MAEQGSLSVEERRARARRVFEAAKRLERVEATLQHLVQQLPALVREVIAIREEIREATQMPGVGDDEQS